MSVRIRFALVAILATVLAANAGATIYAAATAPTIKACVKSSGAQKGLMRYLASGSCATGEKLLAWNVTGPQGPTGPAGPAGGGGAGTASLPTVYASRPTTVTAPYVGLWTLASVNVPAGAYDVRAMGWVEAGTSDPKADAPVLSASCTLGAATWSHKYNQPVGGLKGNRREAATLALEDVVSYPTATTVSVVCTGVGGYDGRAAVSLVATPVKVAP